MEGGFLHIKMIYLTRLTLVLPSRGYEGGSPIEGKLYVYSVKSCFPQEMKVSK